MSKAIREAIHHPPIITVGELIDELCRLPDTATIQFHCPILEQELAFYRLRKRSKDVVEIEVNTYPESPTVVPSANAALRARKKNYHYLIKTKTGARTDAQLARLAAACGLTNFWRRSSSVTPRAEVPPAAMK